MTRRVAWVLLAVVAGAALLFAALGDDTPDTVDARVQRITSELRCEECQGLSVAASNAPTSEAMKADVRRRVEAGQSAGEIRRAYVDRYGEDILLTPQGSGISVLVWLVPVAAFVTAVVALAFAFRRWRRGPWRHPSAADRAIVEELRGSS